MFTIHILSNLIEALILQPCRLSTPLVSSPSSAPDQRLRATIGESVSSASDLWEKIDEYTDCVGKTNTGGGIEGSSIKTFVDNVHI